MLESSAVPECLRRRANRLSWANSQCHRVAELSGDTPFVPADWHFSELADDPPYNSAKHQGVGNPEYETFHRSENEVKRLATRPRIQPHLDFRT